jgi:hypothetical protein
MAQPSTTFRNPTARALVGGFAAGFLATLIFHQLTLALLWEAGIAPFGPFSTAATQPLAVPAVFSLAFWGGVWGVLYALVDSRFPSGGAYWIAAFLFGAIVPTLVALLIVLPLKGQAVGGDWEAALWLTALLVNGAWGVGTGLILMAWSGWLGGPRDTAA